MIDWYKVDPGQSELGTWLWNLETGEVIYGTHVATMLGYKLEEIAPTIDAWKNLLHPEEATLVKAALEDHLTGQTTDFQVEHRLRCKSGDWRWVLGLAKVTARCKTGEPIRVEGFFRDVDQYKSVDDLIKLQHKLSLALSSTSDIVEAFDLVLESVCRLDGIDCGGGYLVGDMTGDLTLVAHRGLSPEFIATTSYHSADAPQSRLVQQGEPVYGYYNNIKTEQNSMRSLEGLRAAAIIPVKHKNKVIAVLNLASHTHDSISKMVCFALESIAIQIGGAIVRIKAETNHRLTKQKLQILFDTLEDFLFVLDDQGNILQTNPAVEAKLGYSLDELLTMHISELHPQEKSPTENRIVADMLVRKALSNSAAWVTKTGQYIPVETKATQGVWDTQNVWFGISRDITKRKQAEDKLRASHQQLQQALIDLEQAQQTIVQQERLAAVGQLTAGIAHDFNNILTSILGSSELLRLAPDTPESLYPKIDSIKKSGLHAAHLVQQMLDFSRKSMRTPKKVDMALLVQESLSLLRQTIPQNICFNFQTAESTAYDISADFTKIQQLLTNLVFNAKDAMPNGGELSIRLSHIEGDNIDICSFCHQSVTGSWVQMKVSDTGKGILPGVLLHIFEPFFTTKPVGRGTGLGLSQVAGIVAQNGGHITVCSNEKGTTFTLYFLPLVNTE